MTGGVLEDAGVKLASKESGGGINGANLTALTAAQSTWEFSIRTGMTTTAQPAWSTDVPRLPRPRQRQGRLPWIPTVDGCPMAPTPESIWPTMVFSAKTARSATVKTAASAREDVSDARRTSRSCARRTAARSLKLGYHLSSRRSLWAMPRVPASALRVGHMVTTDHVELVLDPSSGRVESWPRMMPVVNRLTAS